MKQYTIAFREQVLRAIAAGRAGLTWLSASA